jgi:hypothetical protein
VVKRKPLKRRYRGAKVLHARRYAPKVIPNKKRQLPDDKWSWIEQIWKHIA